MKTAEIPAGYKQTEVGLIPEDWLMEPLSSIGEIFTGGTPSTIVKEYWNGEYPWITPTDITENRDIYTSERKLSKAGFETIKRLPANSLLVTCIASIGKNAILKKEGGCNQQINALIPSPNYDVNFLYYLIEENKNNLIGKAGQTATMIVSKREFSLFRICVPLTKAEQQAIATALSDVDNLISSLEKLIEKKQAIKQGAMQELLTGKRRLKGFEVKKGYKKTEVGVIPEDWEASNVSCLAEIIGGGTPSTKNKRYWNGTINWFTPTEIGDDKYSYSSKRKITNEGLINSSAKLLPKGTILLTSRATIGEVSILQVPSATNQGFQSLIVNDNSNNEYIYYCLQTMNHLLIKFSSGSTFLELSPQKLKSILLPTPPTKAEQTAIATVLSDMDTEIEALEKKTEKYKQIKQGMMQNLLTGKIRLI